MSYTKLTDFASKDALLTGNPSKLVRGTELGAEFDAIETADALNIKPDTVTAATGKTTPVDADLLTLFDSASTFSLKKLTWANVKATLKTYFDTLYVTPGANSNITSLTGITSYAGSLAFRSYLAGLTMSTAGSSATMSIAAGACMDSTNAYLMQLSAISKTTSAWAVGTGNGGIDTGAVANSTWYHFYVIRRPDTGVVDVIFSLSASSPTLPTNYTQYRRIGSGKTNGSAQWTLFQQVGDTFTWDAAVIDADVINPGTAAVSRTITVPTGLAVDAVLFVGGYYSSNAYTVLVSPLSVSDQAPQGISTAALSGFSSSSAMNSVAGWNFSPLVVTVNTSAQVRTRLSASGANDRLGLITRGWIDTRGRDA